MGNFVEFSVLALVAIGFLCGLFLAVVEPIWTIVDVAISNEQSAAAKVVDSTCNMENSKRCR